jgi:hypothetical protein
MLSYSSKIKLHLERHENSSEALKDGSSCPMPKVAWRKVGFRRNGAPAGLWYDLQNV